MPHLQFEINKKIDPEVKEKFITSVLKIFGDVMKTENLKKSLICLLGIISVCFSLTGNKS